MTSSEVVLVSPSVAKDWLRHNTSNRPCNELHVRKLAAFMKNGTWKENGETLKFSSNNKLLDGQHRLMAVIRSDVELPMRVVRGLNEDVFTTIDTGRVRSMSDITAILGYKCTAKLSAAARLVWAYEIDPDLKTAASKKINNIEIEPLYIRHPLIIDSMNVCSHSPIVTAPMLGLNYIFRCVDVEPADYFFQTLVDGDGLQKGDAILALRDFLFNEKASIKKNSRYYCLAMTIKAWNIFYSGKKIKLLTWREKQNEPFPSVSGIDRNKFLSGDQRPIIPSNIEDIAA